jgi:hypothetical protein
MDQQQDHQHSGQDGRQNGDQGSQATSHNSSPFGRGWIPLSRDIGIPGERLARNQRYFEGEGDAAGGAADCRRLGEWVGEVEGDGAHTGFAAAHPQPLPQAGGGQGGGSPLTPSDASTSYMYWTAERQVRFLAVLAENGRVRHACARVGMSFQSAYVLRRRDAAFAQGWDAAMVLARDHAERVLADRAIDGVVETVWYRGEAVGHRRRFDSRLLLAHLARLDAHARSSARGQAAAGRFDDYLAAILAGEADPAERAPVPLSTGPREWPAQGWRPLDPDRPSAIMEAMREAETALTDDIESLRSEAAEALCEGLPLGERPAKQAIEDAVLDQIRAAADQARAEAAAQWDAAFASRTARLDALIPPYSEEEGADAGEGACGDDFADLAAMPAPIPAAEATVDGSTEPLPSEFKSIDAATIGPRTVAAKKMGAGIAPGPHDRSPLASHDFAFDHRVPAPDRFRGTKPLAASGRVAPNPLRGLRRAVRRAACTGLRVSPLGPGMSRTAHRSSNPNRQPSEARSATLPCACDRIWSLAAPVPFGTESTRKVPSHAPGWAPSPLHRPHGLGWALIFPLRRRSRTRDALRHPLRTAFRTERTIPFASVQDGHFQAPRSAVEFFHPETIGNRFPGRPAATFHCSNSAKTDLLP